MGTEITFRRGSNDPTSGSGLTLAEPAFNTTLKTFHIGLGHGITAAWVGAPISGLSADIAAGITYKTPTAKAVKDYVVDYVTAVNGVLTVNGFAGGVTLNAGTEIGVTSSSGNITITNLGVQTFNGRTGAVTGVTVGGANTFTALNTFNAGITTAFLYASTGSTFGGTLKVVGGATFDGRVYVGGNLYAYGSFTSNGDAQFERGVTVLGGATFAATARFTNGLTSSGDIRFSGTATKNIRSTQAPIVITGVSSSGFPASYNRITLPVTSSALELGSATGLVNIVNTSIFAAVPGLRILTDDQDFNGPFGTTIKPGTFASAERTQTLQDASGVIALTSQLMGAVNGSTAATTAVTSFNGRTGAVQGVSAAVAGTGISVSGATGAVTITNTGVTSAVAGTGISVSGATGSVTFTNIGVQSFNGLTGAVTGVASIRGLTGAVGITNGTGIGLSVSGQTMTFSNTGVLSVNGSTGTITNVAKTDEYTNFAALNNSLTVTDTNSFDTININPSSNKIVFYDDSSGNDVQLYVSIFGNQVITFPGGTTKLAGLSETQTFTSTNTFSTLTNFSSGISAAGGVTLAGTFSGTTGSFSRLLTASAGISAAGATFSGDIAVQGGDITTSSATATVFNTTATNLSIGGAATTLTMGGTSGTASIRNSTLVLGNTTNTIATNIGTANDLIIQPYGAVSLAPTTNGPALGTFTSLTVINQSAASGQVQIIGGDLYLGVKSTNDEDFLPVNIIFEGASDDLSQITLTVVDPTADRTITFPDASGTVALTNGVVTSFNGLTGAVTGVSRVNGFTGGITFAASTGITFTASAGTITLSTTGGGGSKTYAVYTPLDNQPPAANYATIDTRNSIMVLDFDAATDESAVFVGIIPEAASLGSGLKIRINWMATSATSGTCRWGVQIERMNTDEDSDSFDTAATAGSTTNATSGIITTTEITITTIDSVVAGDPFRIKVFRDADGTSGTDDMTGDAELVSVEVRSAA